MSKTPQFHSGGTGVIPGQGTKISHAMQTKIEEKKKKVRKKGKREGGKGIILDPSLCSSVKKEAIPVLYFHLILSTLIPATSHRSY